MHDSTLGAIGPHVNRPAASDRPLATPVTSVTLVESPKTILSGSGFGLYWPILSGLLPQKVVTLSAVRKALTRPLRASLVVALLAASVVALVAAPARATTPSGVFLACGYGYIVGAPSLTPTGCTTLDTAITNAEAYGLSSSYKATVVLLPGLYCPIDIPHAYDRLTIQGAGMSGIDGTGTYSYTGPEAALSTFKYSAGNCGSEPGSMVQASAGYDSLGSLTFRNLAIDGTSGPQYGMYFQNESMYLRDVLIQNESTAGISYTGDGIQINESAFLNNANGLVLSGRASIFQSTFAGNTTTGLYLNTSDLTLDNDTIAHNGTGVNIAGSGSTSQANNTIVANNTADCAGYTNGNGDWEWYFGGGGADSASGYNITGSTCVPHTANATDLAYNNSGVAAVADNGGPTPSILPPTQAQNATPQLCGSATTNDQREYVISTGSNCDIGSVDHDANGTSDVQSSLDPMAFGTVPTNQPKSLSTTAYNSAGNLVGVSSIEVTGAAFSLSTNGDQCSYVLLIDADNTYCYISVTASPPTNGVTSNGSLKIHTSNGVVTVALSATGGPPITAPGPPTFVHGTVGNQHVDLSWTAPSDDGGQAIEQYDIRYSTNGGSTFTDGPTTSGTSTQIFSLTNGTPYVFEVAADNGVLVSDYSAMSGALTPHGATHGSALTAVHPVTITDGASTTLSTTLTDTTTLTDMANQGVSLLGRVGDSGPYSTVASPTTNAQGVAQATVHPQHNTQYKWSYAGSTGHSSATTPEGTVSVAQAIHVTLSASKIKHGKTVKIYGTVSPDETGRTVTLLRYNAGKSSIVNTAKIKMQSLPTHKNVVSFLFTYTPSKKGKQTFRVSRAATSSNAAGLSRSLKLKVT